MQQPQIAAVAGRIRLGSLIGLLLIALMLGTAGQAAAPPGSLADRSELPLLAARFEEPLVATGETSPEEDDALAQTIALYNQRAAVDDMRSLEAFLASHPRSAWRLALLTNLGLSYYHYGYFSKAIDAFELGWKEGKATTELHAKALADRAAGELLRMHARLGHSVRLATLLDELKDRGLTGAASEFRDGAKQGLWAMRNKPGVAYLCGPMALRNLLRAFGVPATELAFLDQYQSGPHGTTLAEVGRLADQAKFPYRLIQRNASEPIPVPSIIHWKVNHFAAIIGERAGRYQLADPTFGPNLWVTRAAIDAEGSGYFLVSEGQNNPGWRDVSKTEAISIIGMGITNDNNPPDTTPQDQKAKNNGCNDDMESCDSPPENCNEDPEACDSPPEDCDEDLEACEPPPDDDDGCKGMCGYNFTEMLVSLNLVDTPVGYAPPRGPHIPVRLTYNQREAGQPANFTFANISPKWSLNWLSYIQDDPTLAGATVTRAVAGGGYIDYTGYNTATASFAPEVQDASVLSLSSSTPVRYTRTLRNGQIEVYGLSNGATTFPRFVFLTQITDRYGNTVNLNYDAQFRLISVVDATGRATQFGYGLSGSPLLITKITDPFGRSAQLAYNSAGQLSQITDVLGLTSKFTYDTSGLIDALTTPYGTTSFSYGDNGNERYLQATDPLGYTERLEYNQSAPGIVASDPSNTVPPGIVAPFNNYLYGRDTFYWDKHAYAVAAGNYLMARNRHWAHLASNTSVTSNTIESIKYPLENRIWYNYPGQPTNGLGAAQSGTLNTPTNVARVLDDGSQQLTQKQYDSLGNVTSNIDPVGRQTLFQYAPNQIDLVTVQKNTSSGPITTARYTYNTKHRPLTYTDAAGNITRYAYNRAGQLLQVTDALGNTTAYNYNALGYLINIINANGRTAVSFTYDGFGRVATRTDSEGWTVAFAYDALDRVTKETYPDKTTRTYTYKNLDLVSVKDRQGRVTSLTYDAVRNLISRTDPLGNVTRFGHYENGTLKSLTDPDGHVTTWAIDVESRVTGKTYADGTTYANAYEATTSRLHSVTDPLGQTTQYSYAADNRPTAIQYLNAVNATPSVGFTYDATFPRLTSMIDGSGTTTYAYYPAGTVGALKLAAESPPFANSSIAYQYDTLGRITARSVGGDIETLAYDALSRIITHANDLGTFQSSYLGQTTQLISQSSGIVGTSWVYDTNLNDRRLIQIANNPVASRFLYKSTPENDITAITETLGQQTWSYTYDAADRLKTAASTLGPAYQYGYDDAGNLGPIQTPSGTTAVVGNSLNQVTREGGVVFTYDANGNLLRDYARTYAWDAANRLIGIGYLATPGTVTTFRYDGLGRRIAIDETNGGLIGETRYGWCGETLCQARAATDAVTRRYFAEGEESMTDGSLLYYAADYLGSVRDVIVAQNGLRVAHYDYSPYGTPTRSVGSRLTWTDFRYAGLFYHQSSGLYLATYRAYDPLIGRWLSRDPISEGGGINLYQYVQGNPNTRSDYVGEVGECKHTWNLFDVASCGVARVVQQCAEQLGVSQQDAQELGQGASNLLDHTPLEGPLYYEKWLSDHSNEIDWVNQNLYQGSSLQQSIDGNINNLSGQFNDWWQSTSIYQGWHQAMHALGQP